MECPFALCSAWVTPLAWQAEPGGTETVYRIPEHEIEGSPVRLTCPASLMPVPLNDEARALLEEQFGGVERIVAERFPPPETFEVPASEPPRTPQDRPMGENWFRSRTGDNPKGEHTEGLPVVRPLPGQGVQPDGRYDPAPPPVQPVQERTGMEDHATMANGLLEHAKQLIGEIQETISSLTDRLDETAAGTATFQAKGEEIVGSIVQAAEGSQTHNYRIQDAMALVHAAVNEQSQSAVDAIHLSKESLNRVYRTLAAAREDLDNVVF